MTVLPQTLAQREDVLRLGAIAYHATQDPATFDMAPHLSLLTWPSRRSRSWWDAARSPAR